MKKLSIFLLALVAILLSCNVETVQSDLTTAPETDVLQAQRLLSALTTYDITTYLPDYQIPLTNPRDGADSRPLKIRGAGTLELIFPPINNCGPNEVEVVIAGEGNATHLGLFTFYAPYCTLDGTNPVDPIIGTQTAANGDELYSVLVGAGVDPEFGPYQDWVFFDGTGRFEGATGEIRLFSLVDYMNLTYSNHGEGTITY